MVSNSIFKIFKTNLWGGTNRVSYPDSSPFHVGFALGSHAHASPSILGRFALSTRSSLPTSNWRTFLGTPLILESVLGSTASLRNSCLHPCMISRGVISTSFSWRAKIFSFFNATGLLKNWKNSTFLYLVIWRHSWFTSFFFSFCFVLY